MKSFILKNKLEIIFITIFLIISLVPTFITIFSSEEKSTSETEKRELAKMPNRPKDLKELKKFPNKFQLFFEDNFGLREELISAYSLINYLVFNHSINDQVIIGKDGYIFYSDLDTERTATSMEQENIDQWVKILNERKEELSNQNSCFTFVVIPNKMTIYPEKAPEKIKKEYDLTVLDKFYDQIKSRTDVNIVDAKKVLSSNKKKYQMYHKADTHWTRLGAFLVYQEIMKSIDENCGYEKTYFHKLEDYSINYTKMEHYPDIANLINIGPYLMGKAYFLEPKVQFNKNDQFMLLIGDSFSIKLDYFFRESYVKMERYEIPFGYDKKYIEDNKPDVVVWEMVERYLIRDPYDNPDVEDRF